MKLYIETVGCQMNELDSELVVASLRKDGYELTASPHDADTILFNTCSVRQHAEDKIYSALGRLKNAKKEHPGKVIGVATYPAPTTSAPIPPGPTTSNFGFCANLPDNAGILRPAVAAFLDIATDGEVLASAPFGTSTNPSLQCPF